MKKIGCCDSGLGGILVVNALNEAYPNLDIVYIADQANAPYGNQSHAQLKKYIRAFFHQFITMAIDEVVVACNTLCASVVEEVRQEFPQLTIYSIIQPTVEQLRGNNFKTIHVLATEKTCQSHAYALALAQCGITAHVVEQACPTLVPIIEKGCDTTALEKETKKIVEGLPSCDAWILGCTHYPLIRPYLSQYSQARIYDSNAAVVDLFRHRTIEGDGNVMVYTTKDPEEMQRNIQQILHKTYPTKKISLD